MAGGAADPHVVETKEDLARELTALRTSTGLTVRDLARTLGAPVATVGDYFSGRHLPGPRQVPVFRSILEACGVTDPAATDAWLEALERSRRSSDGRAARTPPPYRGLEAFRDSDAGLFFGRRAAQEELLGVVRRVAADPGQGVVALVGPSGSGKSSLLMAGVLPAVRSGELDSPAGGWQAVAGGGELLDPASGATIPDGGRVLLMIDQFEEVLTAPLEQRQVLLSRLGELAGRAVVVVALRADFYQAAAAEPVLIDGLRQHQVLLGPMTAEELRAAVVEPARRVGCPVEDGLVDLVLSDLAPGATSGFAHDPGALPLLSYALLATWDRAGRNQVTVADYLAVGGLRGAVRQAAESLYGALGEAEQAQARRLFARLVRVDGEGPTTRRRAAREELVETGDADTDARAATVLERFIAARLVTVDAGAVQISHEALLGAWPRLTEWVESDREWLALRQQLAEAARAWDRAHEDESLLWRGSRLDRAAEEAGAAGRELNRRESGFLAASIAHRDAARLAERRRTRRAQQLLAGVAALAVAAVAVGVFAVTSRADAVDARDQALSRQVAIEAQQLAPSDASLAAQLSMAAYRISPTVQARSTLADMTAGEVPYRLLGPAGPTFLAASSDGTVLAAAYSGADTVDLYRAGSGSPSKAAEIDAGPPSAQDYAVAVSPDGHLLAVGGTSHDVTIWDTTDPGRPARIATLTGPTSTVYGLAWSPRHRRLAAADADGTVYRWNLPDPRHPAPASPLHVPGSPALKAVAYSSDGRLLAAAGSGVAAVWDSTAASPSPGVDSSGASYNQLAFNPAGTLLAAAASDGSIHLWTVAPSGALAPARAPLDTGTAQLDSLAVAPDGAQLAAGAADGTVHLFDIATGTRLTTLTGTDPVTAALYSRNGRRLVTADSGGTVRVWPLPTPAAAKAPGNVFFLNWLDGGRTLMATSGGAQGRVRLFDTADPARAVQSADITLPAGMGPVEGAATPTPDGRYVAAANKPAQVEILDITDRSRPRLAAGPLGCAQPLIEQLTVSPDGRQLISGDDSGKLCVWDISDPTRPRLVGTRTDAPAPILGFSISADGRMLAEGSADNKVRLYRLSPTGALQPLATLGGFTNYAYTTAFTPDGRTLIAGSADGTVRMWDLSHPDRPRPVGPPLAGPTGYVYQLSVSPDGRTLAAATTDHSVWVWDISHPGQPVLLDTLRAAADAVFAVRFSPDGRTLAASGSDDTVHLWDYQPDRARAALCAAAGQAITRQEWARYIQGAAYSPPCR